MFENSACQLATRFGYLALVCFILLVPDRVQAQGGFLKDDSARRPLFDAVNVGIGINMFQGDLDGNKNENLLLSLASANPDVFVSLERDLGAAVLSIDLGYHRLQGWAPGNPAFTFKNNVVTIGANAGRPLDFILPGFIRPYAGLAAIVHAPQTSGEPSGHHQVVAGGSWRVNLGVPVGIVIQNRIRLGAHLTFTETLDAVQVRTRPNRDHLLHIHVGLRHEFGRSR